MYLNPNHDQKIAAKFTFLTACAFTAELRGSGALVGRLLKSVPHAPKGQIIDRELLVTCPLMTPRKAQLFGEMHPFNIHS